jgi:hypothetical protein
MTHINSEKGQAGLEFVIVVPVLMLALILLSIVGNQLYQKLSAQNAAYSHCVWEVVDVNLLPDGNSAGNLVFADTKKTWNTEGLWEDYFWQEHYTVETAWTKKCIGSVTHDEWSIVGSKYFKDYNPDVLVESKLSISRSKYQSREGLNLGGQLINLSLWMIQ